MLKWFCLILICEVAYNFYVGLKIYKFVRNQYSSFGHIEGSFTVPVNNIFVCHTSFVFLATDTLLCVLIYIHNCHKSANHYPALAYFLIHNIKAVYHYYNRQGIYLCQHLQCYLSSGRGNYWKLRGLLS